MATDGSVATSPVDRASDELLDRKGIRMIAPSRTQPRKSVSHFVLGDRASMRIDMKLVLLAILHAFTSPMAVISLALGNAAVAGSHQLRLDLFNADPVGAGLVRQSRRGRQASQQQ